MKISRPETYPQRFLQIDQEGFLISNGARLSDPGFGREVLSHLEIDDRFRLWTFVEGQWLGVEAFDAPLVVRDLIRHADGSLEAIGPYDWRFKLALDRLSVDEWDRFHGVTESGLPFVFSRSAQVRFFDFLDSFDDESVSYGGRRFHMENWLIDDPRVDLADFWTDKYLHETPGWEIGSETPVLREVLDQIKLPRSRILCLGAGSGNDAAHLADRGHLVTAVDFSAEAIARAQQKYGDRQGLKFVQKNIFELPREWQGEFDLVFEHTCYCAIRPSRRNEIVKLWSRMLAPGGYFLGVFFAVEKRMGPPWGGNEWELKRRLESQFDFRYWTRWKTGLEKRRGMELVVYAQKKTPRSEQLD